MNFWNYCFSYIFKGYQNRGEKLSAHIYALSILTLLPVTNLLSIFFITSSDNYLGSKSFKELTIGIFIVMLSINSYLFLNKKNYLKLASEYNVLQSEFKLRMRSLFWIYLVVSIIVLVISLVL